MKSIYLPILSVLMTLTTVFSALADSPLTVNATDLIGKVYGVAAPTSNREECRMAAGGNFTGSPYAEDGAEWMSADEGFRICYAGMMPEAEGMARYENGSVTGFGYIFYFPYASTAREDANCEQCRFCSALLQELTDMGVALGSDPMTEALFNVAGVYQGGDIQLTLNEYIDHETLTPDLQAGAIPTDREGSFVLTVSIIPAHALGFTADLSE